MCELGPSRRTEAARRAPPRSHGALIGELPRPARPQDRWLTMNACSRAVRGPSSTPRGLATPARAARPAVCAAIQPRAAQQCHAIRSESRCHGLFFWLVEKHLDHLTRETSTDCDAAGHQIAYCTQAFWGGTRIAGPDSNHWSLRSPETSIHLSRRRGVQAAEGHPRQKTARTRAFRRAQACITHA